MTPQEIDRECSRFAAQLADTEAAHLEAQGWPWVTRRPSALLVLRRAAQILAIVLLTFVTGAILTGHPDVADRFAPQAGIVTAIAFAAAWRERHP
jgi:hypothetical protein